MRTALYGTLLTLAAAAGWANEPPAKAGEATPQQQAQDACQRVESRFESLRSLRYTVSRKTTLGARATEERWAFRFRHPDALRVHYQAPQERLLIANGSNLWEFIPDARKVAHTDLTALSAAERGRRLAAVFARVAVPGMRPGEHRALLARTVRVRADAAAPARLTIEGESPRFLIQLDTQRCVMTRTELYDDSGALTFRAVPDRFQEVAPGFWLPASIQITQSERDTFAVSEIALGEIAVNETLADDWFQFTPPEGVQVVPL